MSDVQSDAIETHTTTVMVCGSGCAGSMLAWILAKQGMDVVLVDRGRHPRFAIGESSTPLADFLIEDIAERYNLPELLPLARWGSWCRSYPQLRRGKKRGFSYFGHDSDRPFFDDDRHSRSLLVTASPTEDLSDTHWMRSDVDHWLCERACEAGTRYFECTEIDSMWRGASGWLIAGKVDGRPQRWAADWLIDATGNAGLVPHAMKVARCDNTLNTRTGSLFGHFTDVQAMTAWQSDAAIDTAADPFDADDAAQHHVLDDGWMWMLRFDCGITSVGFTRPTELWQREGAVAREPALAWRQQLDKYPTLRDLMSRSQLIAPSLASVDSDDTPQLGWMPRISRLWASAAGDGWIALPSTVGIIDPLHSTGLAHAFSGVRRAAEILLHKPSSKQAGDLLARYSREVVDEVRWIDQIVAACYATLPDFELFAAACTFYFLAAIDCERELRLTGQLKHGFLGAQRVQWREMALNFTRQVAECSGSPSAKLRMQMIDQLRRDVQPWNQAGLLDSDRKNRYTRSAAPK